MTLTTSYQLLDEAYLGYNNYGNVYIRLYGKYDSQSIANNTTNVTFQARLYSGATWYASSGTYYNLTVNGSSTGNVSCNRSSGNMWPSGETTLDYKTVTVSHNSDGTKSISGSALFNSSPWGWNNTASKTVDLPTIPRTSKLNSASISISNDGNTVTITPSITKYASSFYDYLCIWNGNTQIAYWNGVSSGTAYTFSAGERSNLWNAMGTSTSISLSVYVYTYTNSSKSTLVGESNKVSATASLPNYSLSLSASVQDSVSAYNNFKTSNNSYISYLSKPKFTFSASSSTGSTYGRSISYSVGGTGATSPYTVNSYTGGTYTVVASDGRKSASSTPSMTNVPYFRPTLNASVVRPTATGSSVNILITGQYYSGTNLTNLLTPSATITYTEEGGTQQTETITLGSNTSGNTTYYSGSLSLSDMDYQKSISWSITVTDRLGVTITSSDTLTRGLPVWNAYRENNTNYMNINGVLQENNNNVICNNGSYYNVNADNFKKTGVYYLCTGCSNIPANWCKLFVMGDYDTTQIASNVVNGKTYIRGWGGSSWSNWREVLFNDTDSVVVDRLNTADLNNATTTGFYRYNKESTNKPSLFGSDQWGLLVVENQGGWVFQTAYTTFTIDNKRMAMRAYINGYWTNWEYPVLCSSGYIESYGNSGIWHYRKWSDGYAELWGTTSQLSFNVTTAWGNIFESPDLAPNISNFPFSFVEAPHVSVSITNGNMNFLSIEQGSPDVNKVNQIFVTRPDSKTNFSCKLKLYITGKWK